MKNFIKLILRLYFFFAIFANHSIAGTPNWDWAILRTANQNYFLATNNTPYDFTLGIRCPHQSGGANKLTLMAVPAQKTVSSKVEISKELQKTDCEAKGHVGLIASDIQTPPFRLPFSTSRGVCVGQAPGRVLTTHKGTDSNAIDFWTLIGEQIVAAKDGIVFDLMSNSDVGGPDPKYTAMANFVSILHADGTLALYAHLLKDSVVVKHGQYVKAGQPIGKSGATGFLGGPHLHFSVGRPTVDEKTQKLGNAYQTIAVKFSINAETTEVRTLDYLTLSSTRGSVEHNRSSCNSSPY